MESELRLIKTADMKSMPWKNGGGTTLEVAISPAGASVAALDFDWRVSIASIESDGPFSQFKGYDRELVVWKGEGLVVNGELRARLQTFAFAGEENIEAKIPAGVIKDFGVIHRRGKGDAEIIVQAMKQDAIYLHEFRGDAFLLCAEGELRIGGFYLNPGDVVHATTGVGSVSVTALEHSQLVIASISP